jgi:predicted DNA-binding transcriptional regulator YafY
MEAESIALRPGPRQAIPGDLLAELRHAIIACRQVRLHYRAQGTGRLSRQLVCPYGFLYGSRHYLVGYSLSDRARDYRLFSLANIEKVELTDMPFERRQDFSLRVEAILAKQLDVARRIIGSQHEAVEYLPSA